YNQRRKEYIQQKNKERYSKSQGINTTFVPPQKINTTSEVHEINTTDELIQARREIINTTETANPERKSSGETKPNQLIQPNSLWSDYYPVKKPTCASCLQAGIKENEYHFCSEELVQAGIYQCQVKHWVKFYHDSHMKKCDCSRQYIIDFLNNLSEESKVDDVIKELFKFLFGASPNQITSEDVEMMKKKLRLPLHWGGPSIHGGLLSYTKKTLSEKVINQIKHLPRYHNLNSEQKKLVDKLIRNGELNLHNSQNITTDFLQEITNYKLLDYDNIVNCYGISRESENEFYQEYINETTEYNESFSMLNDSPLYSYEIHPSAIYTSRLLDFKNLPKPQNSKEINEWFYSQSKNEISVDTKLLNFIEKAQKNNLTSVFTNLELSEKKVFPEDAAYCKWLKDEIKMNPEEFLNENNKEELYELFQEYEKQQFQAQILFKEH
ncbi:17513_t:CDS:2, partial [Racocetra fulgida]